MASMQELYSGSHNAWGTEYGLTAQSTTLGSQTTDTVSEVHLDLSTMAAGDVYRVRVYEKLRSADSQIVYYDVSPTGPQSTPLVIDVGMLLHGWEVSVHCTAGTNTRVIKWSFRGVA